MFLKTLRTKERTNQCGKILKADSRLCTNQANFLCLLNHKSHLQTELVKILLKE